MDKKELKMKAQKIINELWLDQEDGGLHFEDLNNAYENVVKLAESYNESNLREYEAKLDSLGEI